MRVWGANGADLDIIPAAWLTKFYEAGNELYEVSRESDHVKLFYEQSIS
jgi:hypothetical protein